MQTRSTKDLVQRCAKDRNHDVWQEFFDRFERRIVSRVHRTLRRFDARLGVDERQDLLQEVYCRLLERQGRCLERCRGEVDHAVAAYLAKIAETVVVDHLRGLSAAKRGAGRQLDRHRVPESDIAEWLACSERSPEERLLRRERHQRFLSRCRELIGSRTPRRDLEVVYLAFFEGLTSREISRRMGESLSPSAVDSLVHRLKRRLIESGVEVPRRRSAARRVFEVDL